ncbi:transposase [Frankia sp. AiPs1]|uniref:transposase n=1 Tax=Frankia sp. AiPa1 TaxID=573492 RepID=UPI00202B8208|nr:transposase [Frankia sp. AiPa1]MCL9760921.1 transposase [Frankia sp. AiPa1]
MGRPTRYAPAFRARAVEEVRKARPQHTSQWATIRAVSASLAISAETLRTWVRQTDPAATHTFAEIRRHQAEIRRLAQENSQLRHALDLLRRTTSPPAGSTRSLPGPAQPPAAQQNLLA